MKNVLKAMMAMAAVSVMALPAHAAGSDDANLEVKATVVNNCLIETTELDFDDYDPVGTHKSAALDGQGSVTVTCTMGAPVLITLGGGTNEDGSSGTAPKRQMADAAGEQFLAYDLFSDAGYSAVWSMDETASVEREGTGVADTLIVYGRVAANQNVPAGEYTDTVVATVTF